MPGLGLGLGLGLTRPTPNKGVGGSGLKPLSMRRVSGLVDLVLPSPYSSVGPGMVHPSVVYVPAGWNGYKWWMAVTPYPNANDDYENPCILASTDGKTWVVPPGVTNPIVPMPADPVNYYNSDPHLILNADGSKLLLIYRLFGGPTEPKETLFLMDSADGVNWSTPQAIFTSNSTQQRLVSPSMWWDGSQYVIVATDLVPAGRPFKRLANGGSNPYSGWPAVTTDVSCPHPTGGSWWHGFMLRLPSGRIMGLTQDGSSGGGNLYLTDSWDNGQTFSVAPFDLSGGFYRSSFAPTEEAGNGAGLLFAGRISPSFKVQLADIQFDRQTAPAAVQKFLDDTIAASSSSTWADDFSRADSPTSVGSAKSGQAYVVDTGTFGIQSGQAYTPSTANSRALLVLGAGAQNIHMVGQLSSLGTQAWFIFRAVDTQNYWRVGFTSGNLRLQKIVAGNVTADNLLQSGTASATSLIEVFADATSIRVFVDAVILGEYAETPAAATRVGFQAAGAVPTYFKRFAAVRI